LIIAVAGQGCVFAPLRFIADEAWDVATQAPAAPGRYLTEAWSLFARHDPGASPDWESTLRL
jgi:hypothetical protein